MHQKITLLDEIRRLDDEHTPAREEWRKQASLYSPEQRENIAGKKERYTQILQKLQMLEERISEGIKQCEDEVNKELRLLYKSRSATRAYLKYESGPPRFIDKRK